MIDKYNPALESSVRSNRLSLSRTRLRARVWASPRCMDGSPSSRRAANKIAGTVFPSVIAVAVEKTDETRFLARARSLDFGTVKNVLMADLLKPVIQVLAKFPASHRTSPSRNKIARSLDSWFDTFSERLL